MPHFRPLLTLFISLVIAACANENKSLDESLLEERSKLDSDVIISKQGDTIRTGMPIPAIGEWRNIDSLISYKSSAVADVPALVVPAHPNRYIAKAPSVLSINKELIITTPGQDSVPLPTETLAKGKTVVVQCPKPELALPLRTKDHATYDVVHLTELDGLLSSRVYAVIEDRRQNLWFGTAEGLTFYNGHHFIHYTTEHGLNDNRIIALFEDSKGNLWIGTEDGAIQYDGTNFTHFRVTPTLIHGRALEDVVHTIFEDLDGNIWFGTTFGGASRFDGKNFTHYSLEQGLSHQQVVSILETRDGKFWFGTTFGGVNYFDGNSFIQFDEKAGFSKSCYAILEDSQGNFWFGTNYGAVHYDGTDFFRYTANEGLSDASINSIVEDDQGNIWFGSSDRGLISYDGKNFVHIAERQGAANQVSSLTTDHWGNLWCGTDQGVMRYNPNSFVRFGPEAGLNVSEALSMLKDSKGELWVGGWRGLIRYDGKNFISYPQKNLSFGAIFSIAENQNGELWFGADMGVVKFDGVRFQQIFKKQEFPERVYSLLFDEQGHLWRSIFGGFGKDFIIRHNGRNFEQYIPQGEFGSLTFGVRNMMKDKDGNLWLGSWQGLVSRFNGKDFVLFDIGKSQTSYAITSMAEDGLGNIWFGSRRGEVCRFDGREFSYFSISKNYSNEVIYSLQPDRSNNIWISTDKGLTILSPKLSKDERELDESPNEYQSFNFGKSDGLLQPKLRYGSSIDEENRLWLGTLDGLTMLNLDEFQLPTEPPQQVGLNHIEIAQEFIDFRSLTDGFPKQKYPFEKSLSQSFDSTVAFYNYPHTLNLPHELDNLTFHFSAVDWFAPHKIEYTYQLDGLENEWNPLTEDTKAEYRNLPHGHFIFKVKAIGAAQIWSEIFEYPFTIRPPWWLTWWAYSLYALLSIGFVFALIQWRTTNLRKRQAELEQTVTERTAELVTEKNRVEQQKEVIQKEKERSDKLLLNILPSNIAEELKENGTSPARHFNQVTVLFTDFVQFTTISEQLSPEELVAEINVYFKAFDEIVTKCGIEKIKTIGDAYMAAGGLQLPRSTSPQDVILAALEMQRFIRSRQSSRQLKDAPFFEMRCGIHTGPVVAGIVGVKKFQYDIWGDTVNTASRMESSGEAGRVNISQFTYKLIKDDPRFSFEFRGKIEAKHKGAVEMYFVEEAELI